MTLQPAVRSSVKPLVGFFGLSGGGKTLTALLLARGLAGSTGKINVIDTENKRASLFADIVPGGYNVLNLEPPFTPDRYAEAFEVCEKDSSVIVVDSLSHEWEGEGGVLDMQEDEFQRMGARESVKMASWIKPKMAHKRLIQKMLRSPVPVIFCLRAVLKTVMGKDSNGKTTVSTSEWPEPIYDPRFIFELLIHAEVYQKEGRGGFLRITKLSREETRQCLPGSDRQLSVEHGESLARWCTGGKPRPTTDDPKRILWKITQPYHLGDKDKLQQWLVDQGLLSDTEVLSEITSQRIQEVITRINGGLTNPT